MAKSLVGLIGCCDAGQRTHLLRGGASAAQPAALRSGVRDGSEGGGDGCADLLPQGHAGGRRSSCLALQCDDVWQASNRKCMDTSEKGLLRSVPKGFAYCYVEWSNITGPGGKHGPHDRGREELQAEFRTGRFGGYAGSADERDVATQLGGRGGCGRVFPLWRTVVEAIFEGVEKVRLDGGIGWMACLLE